MNELTAAYLRSRIALHGSTAFLPPSTATSVIAAAQPPMDVPKKPVKAKPPTTIHDDALKFPAGAPPVTITAGYANLQEAWTGAASIDDLNAQICTCLKCPLGNTRTKFVFGVGNPQAKLVVIGEAPGKDEDAQGEPFVGRAGQLLNKILEAINFKREDVFICNILKCRPPGNRDPLPEEVAQCEPYLHKQLDLIKPNLILALGRIAANTLLKTSLSMRDLRLSMHDYHGIPLMATYHPAALLRNPAWKHETWEDVKKLRALYDTLL